MGITFVGHAESRSGATTSMAATLPSGTQVGDLIFVHISRGFADSIVSGGTTGTTVLAGGETDALNHILYYFATIAGAQQVGFEMTASVRGTIAVNVFRGVSTSSTINVSSSASVSSQSVLSFAQPTSTVNGCMILRTLRFASGSSGDTSVSITAGTLSGGYISTGTNGFSAVASTFELQTSAGLVGSATALVSGGSGVADLAGWTFAIRPDQPPSAPSGISLSPSPIDTTGTVSFTRGTDPEGAAVFTEVEFSTDGGSNFSTLATSASNASTCAVNMSGVTAGTNTYLRLRSRANGLYSSYVSFGAFTVQHAPTAPVILTPTAGITRTLGRTYSITWNPSSDPNTAQSALTYQVDVSYNNQNTWNSIGTTAAGVTNISTTWSGGSAGVQNYVRVRANDGTLNGTYAIAGPFTLVADAVPGAPGSLSPSAGAFDRGQALTMTWVFNDPGDDQGGYTIEWGTDGSTWPNTSTQNVSTQQHTFAASTFSAGTVYIRVKTKDAGGQFGAYSQVSLTASTKPTTPTITSPTSGGTVGTAQPTITWTSSGQASYELVITSSTDVQLWTSGLTTSAATSRQIGISLQNSTSYKVKLYIKNSDGIQSDTATHSFTVTFTQPAVPTLALYPSTTGGYTIVTIQNPAPQGGQPNVSYNEVWRYVVSAGVATAIRIGTNIGTAINGYFKDRTAASGVQYGYFARAYASNGLFSQSTAQTATLTLQALWLHTVNDPAATLFNVVNIAQNDSYQHSGRMVEVDGSSEPIAVFMNRTQRTIDYTVIAKDGDGTKENIEALFNLKQIICARDGKGNKTFGALHKLPAAYATSHIVYTLSLERARYTEAEQVVSSSETSPFTSSLLSSLVSFWKLDNVNDSVGSNTLTNNSSVTFEAGKVGNAARFTRSGTTSNFLSHADNADLSTGDIDFTLCAWVKLATKPGAGYAPYFFSKNDGTAGNAEYSLAYVVSSDNFQFYTGDGVSQTGVSSVAGVSTGTWYFLVAGHDSVNNRIYISVNGGTAVTMPFTGTIPSTTTAFGIGGRGDVGYDGLDGWMDAVGFWKRLLTAEEISELYNAGNGIEWPFAPSV